MRWEQLENILQRTLKPLRDRVFIMLGRGVVRGSNNLQKVQELQLAALAGESLDRVQYFQHFGFTSVPPDDTEAIIVSLGGNRSNSIVIATEKSAVRLLGLLKGESGLYTDDGTYLILKKNGQVELKTATKFKIDAPDTEITGNVLIKGDTVIDKTLLVKDNATFQKNVNVTMNVVVTALVQAAGYTGPGGGALVTTVAIQTTGNITGGGTDMATIKSTFNAHTHPETGTTTQVTGTPL